MNSDDQRPRKKARIDNNSGGDEDSGAVRTVIHSPVARAFGSMDQESKSARSDPVYQYCCALPQVSGFIPIVGEVEMNIAMGEMAITGKTPSNTSIHDESS